MAELRGHSKLETSIYFIQCSGRTNELKFLSFLDCYAVLLGVHFTAF